MHCFIAGLPFLCTVRRAPLFLVGFRLLYRESNVYPQLDRNNSADKYTGGPSCLSIAYLADSINLFCNGRVNFTLTNKGSNLLFTQIW